MGNEVTKETINKVIEILEMEMKNAEDCMDTFPTDQCRFPKEYAMGRLDVSRDLRKKLEGY